MNRRGTVLVLVLVIVSMAAMVAAGLLFSLRAEMGAAAATTGRQQGYEAAMSGIQTASLVLQQYRGDRSVWWDNPELFENHLVGTDGADTWYFSLYADTPAADGTVRFGISDENGKINLNVPDPQVLANLPNMTPELVDALMDYVDRDSDPRPSGAEQDYYDSLAIPYVIKNGPLVTLEELLLVKGFTASIVYGEDVNFNGILDPNEDDRDDSFPPDNGDGQLDRGLAALCTTVSFEPNVDSSGQRRVDLNTATAVSLRNLGLPRETGDFVELYRAEGNVFKHPSELLDMRYQLKQNHGNNAGTRAGAQVVSGVGRGQLAAVLDRLTVLPGNRPIVGAINVNTAPAGVLAALPGMDSNLASKIIETRGAGTLSADDTKTPAWLYTQGLLSAAQFKAIAPRLGARSCQFRIRSVGFAVPSGRFRALEAVMDFSGSAPRMLYLRDLTRLGMPFAPVVEQ